jgi:hypothetical protein
MSASTERDATLIASHLLNRVGESDYVGSKVFADLIEMAKMAIEEQTAREGKSLIPAFDSTKRVRLRYYN